MPTTIRIACAGLSSALLAWLVYPFYIAQLKKLSLGQNVRDDGPLSHLTKQGTPTMGGLLLLLAILISSLLWCDLTKIGVWLVLYVLCGLGAIGFTDDLKKITKNNSTGLSAKQKLIGQLLIAGSALLLYQANWPSMPYSSSLSLPFIAPDSLSLNLSMPVYFILGLIIILGTSNGVNLSDGLDGLAIGPVIISATVLMTAAIGLGFTDLAVLCGAMIGASVSFLWFNCHPAQIFMGDTGSLPLGGALAMLAILLRLELISAILHGLFLAEALSVMLQVGSFKLRKKRIFKMAPLHHHFELSGWPETKVVIRFWILAGLCGLLAAMSFSVVC